MSKPSLSPIHPNRRGYNSLSTQAQPGDLQVMRDMVLMNIQFFTNQELAACLREGIISEEDLEDALSEASA